MKRNRANDTQPMLDRPPSPAETTAPMGPGERTVPGGPPPTTLPPSTTTLPPSGTTLPPTSAATPEEVHEANNLLAAFKDRPLKAPAPRPKQQANSNGEGYAAYAAVARPVAAYGRGHDPSLVDVKIAELAAMPADSIPSGPPVEGRRDNPTVLITASQKKRTRTLAVGIGAGVVIGSVITGLVLVRLHTAPTTAAASVVAAPSSPPLSVTPPASQPSAASAPSSAQPTGPGAPAVASSSPEPPTAPVASPIPNKMAPTASARRPHGLPRTPQPSTPDDGFHW
jgi:hypothetical protein